jgi:putative phosphoribosyl transferase
VARYRDRVDAGRRLASLLADVAGQEAVVLGLPRGGVVVAAAVAEAIGAPLDVLVVGKVGAPAQPELALGAVGEDGTTVVNDRVVASLGIPSDALARAVLVQQAAVARRARELRGDRPPLALRGRLAIVVDDGAATGATARAASQVARARQAQRVVVAVPLASAGARDALREVVDGFVCPSVPTRFSSVGAGYADFDEVLDAEVVALLEAARRDRTS